jgi:hypothetical protein
MQLDRGGHGYRVQFLIVENCEIPLLRLVTSEQLGLIKIIDSDSASSINVLREVSRVEKTCLTSRWEKRKFCVSIAMFSMVWAVYLENITLKLTRDRLPVIHSPRRVPVAIREVVRKELEDMEANGIIAKVVEPTPWVSSMVVVRKENGKVRICIDPRDLNEAVKRCHNPLPTLEEVATRLPKAKVFSVLDAKSGFWQVKLSESSCKLMTFNTPYGRYYWKRMPFGIKSAPEV